MSGAVSLPPLKWKSGSGEVAATTTVDVLVCPLSDILSADYKVTFYDAGKTKFKSLNAKVTRQGATVCDCIYSIIGDTIKVYLNFVLVGSDVFLRLQNTETFAVSYSLERITLH